MAAEVIHNEEKNRYEVWLDGEKVGHADYTRMLDELHFVHTEVDPNQQGKGLAGILMEGAVADVRAHNRGKIVPVCSYVVTWFKRHPEAADLLKG